MPQDKMGTGMKVKTGVPGRGKTWYGSCCAWPRPVVEMDSASQRRAARIKTYGSLENYERYKAEVAAYMSTHPDCTTFDIALECHMSEKMVRSLR